MHRQYYFYRKDGLDQRIKHKDIFLLESADNYVKIHTYSEIHLVRVTLELAMEVLQELDLVQVHRSYAVNLAYVDKIGKDSLTIFDVPDMEIPVSRGFYIERLMPRLSFIEMNITR